MATIKSQLSLNDGMSAVLKKITFALDTTLGTFEQMQRASGQAIDVENITKARGLLVEANADFERMANEMAKAAREQERLNGNIERGTSAADGMLKKVISIVGAYASISTIKGFAANAMEAADVQIGAQVQLRTVLNNMGASDVYTDMADTIDGAELENTLTLDTTGALSEYDAAVDAMTGGAPDIELRLDTTQAISAYDAIAQKAADIQSQGMYGDEAMIAGAAELATYFSDTTAILSMMDTLTNYAAGMSNGEALDAAAMVDYATGIGKIMSGSYDAMTKKGFEFSDAQKAIIEGTATEQQIIDTLGAEYADLSGEMQAAAVIQGVIDEGWAGLYEAMSNTPLGLVTQLNNALGDVQENVGAGIYPAFLNLVRTVQGNLPQINTAALGIASVLGYIITILTAVADVSLSVATVIIDNWSWIGPLVMGAALALGVYWAATQGVAIAQGIAAGATAAYHAVVNFLSIGFGILTGNTAAASAAVFTFNSALMASPITWVILAIIALIAIIYAAVGAVNHFAGTSVSATGIITGAFAVLGAHVLNGTVIPLYNGFASFINFIGNAFNDPIAAIQVAFLDMCLSVVGYIKNLAAGIENLLNKIPGVTVDITSGLDSFYAGLEQAQQAVKDESGWVEYVSKMDYIDYSDAASAGYNFGQGVEDKIGGLFSYDTGSLDDLMAQIPDIPGMDGMGSDISDIAGNTGSMAKSLEVSGEELEYLRDIAERDAINRFTTAEVKIDMTGMTNKIDGGADLDGVIRELTDGFTEALVTAAEGVHA